MFVCLFVKGNEMGETLSRHASELKLPQHHSSHRDLTPYTELMAWLKQADHNSFKELAKVGFLTVNLMNFLNRQRHLPVLEMSIISFGDNRMRI